MSKSKPTFSSEFKEDAASLVLDKSYSYREACEAVGVGESALRRWVNQLRTERQGVTPKGRAITSDQQEIQGLQARVMIFPRFHRHPEKSVHAAFANS